MDEFPTPFGNRLSLNLKPVLPLNVTVTFPTPFGNRLSLNTEYLYGSPIREMSFQPLSGIASLSTRSDGYRAESRSNGFQPLSGIASLSTIKLLLQTINILLFPTPFGNRLSLNADSSSD